MIIEQKGSELINSQEFKTSNFGVDEEDMPFLISLLRDKIYSDKMAAVIREYGTNAVDAHIEAGCPEKPFSVTLPTQLNQEFKVRDFGLGMSFEKIDKLYTKYCKSTKRNSNDANGALGLGCKAGFAYGDNFVVVSYFGGKKSTYNIVAGPDGSGQALLLDESDTKEPAGVEIIIPVPDHEITEFNKKAASIYKHFRVQPEVSGGGESFSMSFDTHFEGDFWKLLKKDKSSYFHKHSNPLAVMGDVAYPINIELLNNKLGYEYSYLSYISLVLNFSIGDLDINPSRESLEYTSKTYEAIDARLKEFQNSLSKFVSQKISSAGDLLSAYKYLRVFLSDLPRELRGSRTSTPFKWKDIHLDTNCVIHATPGVSASAFSFANRFGKKTHTFRRINYSNSNGTSYIDISDKYKYLFIPVGEKLKWKMYSIEQYFEDNGDEQSLMIFSFDDQKSYDEFAKKNNVKHYGKDQFQSAKLIEKEKPKILVDGKPRSSNYCPKRNCRVFEFQNGAFDYDKTYWEPVAKEDIPKKAYYVEINRYIPVNHGCENLCNSNIHKKVELMSKILGKKAPKIYGVKSIDVHKIENDWVEIGSWFISHVSEFKSSKEVRDAIRDQVLSSMHDFNLFSKPLQDLSHNHLLNRTIRFLNTCSAPHSHYNLLSGFPAEFKEAYEERAKSFNVKLAAKKRVSRVRDTYPLLKIAEHSYTRANEIDIANYIKGIDCLEVKNT